MINQISFKNYKAFDTGEIKIKPITIFLGANSVGKSSVIQLLLMLQQTALSNKYKSALRLHGEFISLGENENIFNKKNFDKDLEISFNFTDKNLFKLIKKKFFEQLTSSLSDRFDLSFSILGHYLNDKKHDSKWDDLNVSKFLEKASTKSKDEFLQSWKDLSKITNYINQKVTEGNNEGEINNPWHSNDLRRFIIPKTEWVDDVVMSNLGELYDLFKNFQKITNNDFNISFQIKNIRRKKENALKISSLKISNDNKCIIELNFVINKAKGQYSDVFIQSDFIANESSIFSGKKKDLLKSIQYDSTLFYLFQSPETESNLDDLVQDKTSLTIVVDSIFSTALNTLRKSFRREMINYVSPLRAHPKRYYFLDRAKINTSLDTLDGNSLTEVLKENDLIKSKVNIWLKKFGISVDVSTLEDVIHKLKITQGGLNLDITDVGFGISQVLPVIVQGFLSYPKSLTVIEQPEIHLHPKMQADLADLFIDIIYASNELDPTKFLIIETHSEYLLKRLRRRMAEKEKINTNDVAIYFFNPQEQNAGCSIEEKKISNEGAFEWPKNFYSGELLQDTIQFIKQQGY